MSVAAILQQMAENAGRSRLQQGAIIGDVINRASQVPAEIMNQRDADALRARGEARLNAQDARSAAQDARQTAADQRDQAAAKAQAEYKSAVDAGLTAAIGDSGDPTQFDARAAYAAVSQAGHPEAIRDVIARHREIVTKPVEFDPTKGLQNPDTGEVLRQPVPKPVVPTVASLDAEQQRILAKPEAERTPDEVASMNAYNARRTPPKAAGPGQIHDTPNGLVRIGDDNTITPLGVRGYHPPPAGGPVDATAPPSKAEIAMANYMVPTPSPRSFATPAGKAMMDRILTVNPDFDASLYSVRAPTRKAYTTGPQGQQLTAMNTAIEHLDQLQAAADALQNGEFKPGNAVYNSLKDMFGSSAPTTFATIKEKVDKELDAVASKGVPTVSGAAAQKQIGGVTSSPASIKAYIDSSIKLLGSSQNALRAPYKRVMGANAPFDPLTPEAKAVLVKRGFDPENPTAATDTGAPKEGETKPIDGYPGTEQTFKNGKWIRTK